MNTRLVSTRISRQAFEVLEARATRARKGVSQYASRLLEWALLVAGEAELSATTASAPPGAGMDADVLRALLAEQFYASAALEKFLGKQAGLSEALRREATARAAELVPRGAPIPRSGAEAARATKRPAPKPDPRATPEATTSPAVDPERAALIERLIGGKHGT